MNNGVVKEREGPAPSSGGFQVRLAGGRPSATDGPFTETREVVGGYVVAEFGSRDQALGMARQFMELHWVHWPEFEEVCEVRRIEQ
jgi:hypothetical protein